MQLIEAMRDPDYFRLTAHPCVMSPQVLLLGVSIPMPASRKEKEQKGGSSLIRYSHHFCLHSIGQNLVTWSYLAKRKAEKCSLHSTWTVPSKKLG